MISTPRPAASEEFTREGAVCREKFHDALTEQLAKVPFGKERISDCFTGYELWREERFKSVFAPPGARVKCGYCERFRDLKGELHVDHHRPKSAVSEWTEAPQEVALTRPPTRRVSLGYWWLAWHWPNLLLACWTCNAWWKRDLFPLSAPPDRRPLLLHPYDAFSTRDHFRWDDKGYIAGVSEQGRATICTCGLNRSELVAARLGVYRVVTETTDRLIDALRHGSPQERERCEKRLWHLGAREGEFTGMVRWVIEEQLGVATEDFFDVP